MKANRERARENEEQVLLAVGLVGWLTINQVGAWVWPASSAHSARNRAAEVLARLDRAGEVRRRKTAAGVWAYLLTNTGAARANDQLTAPLCRNGYELSQLDVLKQSLIVTYLLAHPDVARLGPAGVRGARRAGILPAPALGEADALRADGTVGEWVPALVVRSLHPEQVRKARRVRAAAGRVELLGSRHLVREFERAMGAVWE
jgi:hypothetical protein